MENQSRRDAESIQFNENQVWLMATRFMEKLICKDLFSFSFSFLVFFYGQRSHGIFNHHNILFLEEGVGRGGGVLLLCNGKRLSNLYFSSVLLVLLPYSY